MSRPEQDELRDFPDIHSASSAAAERHEIICGCSHSHQRRRGAPCRTPGCNLGPALDLDVESVNSLLFVSQGVVFATIAPHPGAAGICGENYAHIRPIIGPG